jgi:hypothetical protein
MRSPAALATLAALALAAVPAVAAEPAPAAPAPAPATPAAPAYPMTPAPYLVPYGMVPVPYSTPPPYGAWTQPFAFVEGRTSNAMRITGLVFFGLGAVTTTAGAVVLFASELQSCGYAIDPVANRHAPFQRTRRELIGVAQEGLTSCDGGPTAGAATIAVGALLGVVGVPLFIVGSKSALVPAPAVHLGAGTADLRWSF